VNCSDKNRNKSDVKKKNGGGWNKKVERSRAGLKNSVENPW
jgi:hypothetical protein